MKKIYFLLYLVSVISILTCASVFAGVGVKMYSYTFYDKLKTCTPYSETSASGNYIKIIGQNGDYCGIIRGNTYNKEACTFNKSEIANLVEAGKQMTEPKVPWWNFGNNIFNQDPEQNYWNMYKYKCRKIKK